MHDLFFQRYQALKSEDMKALRTSANEAQRASLQRKHLCRHRAGKQTVLSIEELPPSINHLPALCKRSICVYSKTPREACFPSSPDQVRQQSSHCPEQAAHSQVLSLLPSWRPHRQLWTTVRVHPTRVCPALPQCRGECSATGH